MRRNLPMPCPCGSNKTSYWQLDARGIELCRTIAIIGPTSPSMGSDHMTVNNNEWLRDQRKLQVAAPTPHDSWLSHLLGSTGSKAAIVAGLALLVSGSFTIAIAIGIGTAIGFAIKENT
jgi:hypothetical protein